MATKLENPGDAGARLLAALYAYGECRKTQRPVTLGGVRFSVRRGNVSYSAEPSDWNVGTMAEEALARGRASALRAKE